MVLKERGFGHVKRRDESNTGRRLLWIKSLSQVGIEGVMEVYGYCTGEVHNFGVMV